MKTPSGILLAFALSSTALWAGCAAEDNTADNGVAADERGNGAGKADEFDPADCETTRLDDNGVCRNELGQFAPAVCCAEEAACLNATIDAGGQCRDEESGQFVPAACCEALCEGAQIINGFCRNVDSGQFMLSACCADQCFELEPATESFGSCEGSCGGQSPDGCFCDEFCAQEGDCCADAAEVCPDEVGTQETDQAHSCADACGGPAPSELCFCDDACAELGDCCGDKVAECGGEGNDAVVACEVDACEGAEVDEHFICRTPGGQFASPACCGLDRCDNADLEETAEGQFVCRDDQSGQFVPMICCDQMCADAALDRHGICRNGNGTFADPSCCADDCFQAQERGRVEVVPGCNGEQTACTSDADCAAGETCQGGACTDA